MERQRRNTKKYSFRQPDLKELRNLTSYVLDPLGFKARFGKLLSILATQVDEGLMSVLVQFYDSLYHCFTFPDFQILPTLEEYAYLVGILILDQLSFNGLESIPTSQEIADMLHIDESLIGTHMTTKGGIQGLPSEFLIAQATMYGKDMSEDAFEAIFVLLIYGLVLFPNIDKFVDVNAIRIFSTLNFVPTLLGDTYFSLHMRNAKGGGTIACCLPLLYKWFISHLPQTIIDSCGEFSNVPFLGTCAGINYNPILARRQLGFRLKDKPNNILLEGVFFQEGKDPQGLKGRMVRAWRKIHRKGRKELGPKNCIALEPYTSWVRRRASEYLMPYEYPRPTPLVEVGPSTLPDPGACKFPVFRPKWHSGQFFDVQIEEVSDVQVDATCGIQASFRYSDRSGIQASFPMFRSKKFPTFRSTQLGAFRPVSGTQAEVAFRLVFRCSDRRSFRRSGQRNLWHSCQFPVFRPKWHPGQFSDVQIEEVSDVQIEEVSDIQVDATCGIQASFPMFRSKKFPTFRSMQLVAFRPVFRYSDRSGAQASFPVFIPMFDNLVSSDAQIEVISSIQIDERHSGHGYFCVTICFGIQANTLFSVFRPTLTVPDGFFIDAQINSPSLC
ncbi:hypothetical protein KIW84_055519 [Lathyrus oleraceus]|uniref:DUF7745 domain-containing protein n=1 Tax=Pisum sativum TaxID=3888 RepID=A0A9D4WY44_PEA|nr:hypothetical protein KIW84_055519 [Pisum sativum]